MLKYIKWIFLVILIILMIILEVRFVNYKDNNSNNDNDQILNNIDEFEIVYDVVWNKIKTITYRNDGIISGMSGLYEEYYMIFTKDTVSYCKWGSAECTDYKYTYSDGVISIDSEEYFLPRGTYNITFNENEIELTQEINGDKTIHYFEVVKG